MTTEPHPIAVYAHQLFIHTNYGDKTLFNTLKLFENEIFSFMSKLYGEMEYGLVTSGGTESNILALYVAKQLSSNRENIVIAPDTVHVSIDKACKLLGYKLVKIPTREAGPVDYHLVEEYTRRYKPFAIVVTAGTTERGVVDPIKQIADIAYDTRTFLHVDASYGGLIVPFLYKHGYLNVNTYFYNGVSSISVDFHKNGLAPIPAGTIMFSEKKARDVVCFKAPYTLQGEYCGLLGTRPGGSIAAIWAIIKYMGIEGYEELAMEMYKRAINLYDSLLSIPGIQAYKPQLPIVVFKHSIIKSEELLKRLMEKGIYLYRAPSLNALRVVVMPHVRDEHIEKLVQAIRDIVETSC